MEKMDFVRKDPNVLLQYCATDSCFSRESSCRFVWTFCFVCKVEARGRASTLDGLGLNGTKGTAEREGETPKSRDEGQNRGRLGGMRGRGGRKCGRRWAWGSGV